MNELLKYLAENENGTITEFHELGNKAGLSGDESDSIVYALANHMMKFLAGGRSSEKGVEEPDPDELKMGIEVETEHVDCPLIAEKIARDHLAEMPDYYTRLKKMENK